MCLVGRVDWLKNSSFSLFFHFFNFDTHGQLRICIKIPGEKENFENFETTPGWASKTSLLGSGPSGGPLGVTFGAKIENLCENHML